MKVVCPGSYDPITLGHIDVALRAAKLFDEVVLAVVHNPNKTGTFPVAERVRLIRESLAEAGGPDNLTIDDVPGGLLVDYCREVGAVGVVKGIRGGTDYAYELPMARMNSEIGDVETIFLPGSPRLEHVSSSLIREVHALGGDVSSMVPSPVLTALDAVKNQ